MTSYELLKLWRERAEKSSAAHYRFAAGRIRLNGLLTIVVVVTSTVVGSSLFAMWSDQSQQANWVLPVLSLVAAASGGLQRALASPEIIERHRVAGAHWDRIFNKLCLLATEFSAESQPDRQVLEPIESAMDEIVEKSPSIPEYMFRRVGLRKTYERLSELDNTPKR